MKVLTLKCKERWLQAPFWFLLLGEQTTSKRTQWLFYYVQILWGKCLERAQRVGVKTRCIKSMVLFRLLQQGKCSLMRTMMEKRKGVWGFKRQVVTGVVHGSYGSHEKGWTGSHLEKWEGWCFAVPGLPREDFLAITTFRDHRAPVKCNIANGLASGT